MSSGMMLLLRHGDDMKIGTSLVNDYKLTNVGIYIYICLYI